MDVFDYRRIVLNDEDSCKQLLKPINYQSIKNGHSFKQNDKEMCVGWLIYNRIYPIFQATKHRKNLNILNNEISTGIIKRNQRIKSKVFRLLYQTKILQNKVFPKNIIFLIINYIV